MILKTALFTICLGFTLHAQSPLEQAWSLAANGRQSEAVALLQTVVKNDPKNAEAHLLLGSLQSEAGLREEAIGQLTEAVKLLPKSADASNALGEAYKQFGDYEAAAKELERTVALNPRFGIAQQNLGAVLLQLAKPDIAAPHLDRAIALLGRSRDAAEAHYLRAKIFSGESSFTKAAEHLEIAVKLRPGFPEAWSDLGLARGASGDSAGAVTALRRSVELDSGDAVAQYRLGAEYLRRDEPQQAIGPLEAALKLRSEDQSVLNSLQTALRQTGRAEEAAMVKQRLAEVLHRRNLQNQNVVKALQVNNEGVALEKAGDLQAAASRYREAENLDPEHVGIRTNYAIALLRLGRWTEGLNELHEASEREPNNRQVELALRDALSKAPADLLPEWARALPRK